MHVHAESRGFLIRHLQLRIQDDDLDELQRWARESGSSQQEIVYGIVREALARRRGAVPPSESEDELILRIIKNPVTRDEKLVSAMVTSYFRLRREDIERRSNAGTDQQTGS